MFFEFVEVFMTEKFRIGSDILVVYGMFGNGGVMNGGVVEVLVEREMGLVLEVVMFLVIDELSEE
ncbi:hypothetical protein, partial [Siminovitchia fortis]|uniref:hypothetical protein n=1 Tax=Siminovitchia fortis TaxID=254758 RepID=UPI0011A78554